MFIHPRRGEGDKEAVASEENTLSEHTTNSFHEELEMSLTQGYGRPTTFTASTWWMMPAASSLL